MSEVLTINTTDNIFKEQVLEPLKLLPETHAMLQQVMPEYNTPLPNTTIDTLFKRMKMTMKLYGGIGLSANQCGIMYRMFVMEEEGQYFACINPKVIEESEKKVKEIEGCLSYIGLSLKIERPEWIKVEFTDINGQTIQAELQGIGARCFLHELDHMNGIRFIDHVGSASLHLAKKKQEKIVKKVVRNKRKNNGFLIP